MRMNDTENDGFDFYTGFEGFFEAEWVHHIASQPLTTTRADGGHQDSEERERATSSSRCLWLAHHHPCLLHRVYGPGPPNLRCGADRASK